MNPNDFGPEEQGSPTPPPHEAIVGIPKAPPVMGMPFAWLFLFLLMGVASVSAIWGSFLLEETHPDRALLHTTLDRLGNEMLWEEIRNPLGKPRGEVYERMAQELEKLPLKTKGAKGSAGRAILILKQTAHPDSPPDFSLLNEETDDILDTKSREEARRVRRELNQALRDLYSAKKLSKQDSARIQKTIRESAGETFPYSLALERAREISGEQESYKQKMIAAGLGFALMFLTGLGVVVVYFLLRVTGQLRPVGLPLQNAPGTLGDHLALRTLAYLVAFVGLGSLLGVQVEDRLGESWGALVSVLVGLVAGILLLYVPFGGISFSLRDLGLKREDVGKGILWGLAGWIANVPFLTFLVPLGLLLRWIPSKEHPVVTQVAEGEPWLPIFLVGSFLAPLVEEIFFRGCFFQGLSLRTGRIGLSLVISALAFAMMHPQGGIALPGLAWVGIMAGFLTYQTGSLLPAIVMHILHNTSLLLLLRLLQA